MYSITVRNNILIAHSLPGEVFGPAQNMHGATYVVDAEFFAKKVNKYNIIMDLGVVTTILAEVLKFYSYKNLDDVDEFTSPNVLFKESYISFMLVSFDAAEDKLLL